MITGKLTEVGQPILDPAAMCVALIVDQGLTEIRIRNRLPTSNLNLPIKICKVKFPALKRGASSIL